MPDNISPNKAGPGPANYFLPSTVGHHNHDMTRSRGPSFSMGLRLPGLFCEQNVQSPSPGPKYQVEYLTKYGRSNVGSNNSNSRQESPKNCSGRNSRNRSLEPPSRSTELQKNSPNIRAHSNIRKYNSYEKRKSIKVGESKIMNELSTFCRESVEVSEVPKPKIFNQWMNKSMPPRYGRQIRNPES